MPTDNKTPKTPEQVDLEYEALDQAARAVREFQSGKLTIARVRQLLAKVSPDELSVVAIGTRVPLRDLVKLRGG